MYTIRDRMLLQDEDYTKQIMHESLNQRLKHKVYIFKFPCHNTSIQMEHPEDTYAECPECHKHYLVTFNANRMKIWS